MVSCSSFEASHGRSITALRIRSVWFASVHLLQRNLETHQYLCHVAFVWMLPFDLPVLDVCSPG
jgi:hypothetical protein